MWNRNRDEVRQSIEEEGQSTVDVANICVDDYRDDDNYCYLCTRSLIPTQLAQLAQDGFRGRVESLSHSSCADRLVRSGQFASTNQPGTQ